MATPSGWLAAFTLSLPRGQSSRGQEIDSCTVSNLSRDEMVQATEEGRGKKYGRQYELSILDAFGGIASVRVFSSVYMDYLYVARCRDRWLLLNVLWQRRPGR